MTLATSDDLLGLFDLNEHGTVVTMTPKAYPHPSTKTATVQAIHDRQYIEAGNISGNHPMLTCRSADIDDNGIDMGARVTANGQDYVIRIIEPDGTGISVVVLEEED